MSKKVVKLEGVEFHLNPLKARHVLRATKTIVQLIGAGVKGGTKKEILAAVSDGLHSMEDDDFMEFCLLMLSTIQVVKPGAPAFDLTTEEAFDLAFDGIGIEQVFVLLYEVLVFNRFPLVRDLDLNIGELISTVSLSIRDEMQPEDKKNDSEAQENSQKSSSPSGGSGESA